MRAWRKFYGHFCPRRKAANFCRPDTDHFKKHQVQEWASFWRLSPWISPRPTESWLPIEVHWLPTTQRFPAVDTNTQVATNIFHILASTHTQGAHHPDEHKAYYCVIHGRCHQRPGPAQPPPRLTSTHIHLPRHQVRCHPLPPSSMSLSYSIGLMSPFLIRLQVIQLLAFVILKGRLRTERCKKTNRGMASFLKMQHLSLKTLTAWL